MAVHEAGEEYVGPALLATTSNGEVDEVEVQLRGHFHWYGRVAADAALTERHRAGTAVVLKTPYGAASGKIADLDPWGRFRITGLGAPPF